MNAVCDVRASLIAPPIIDVEPEMIPTTETDLSWAREPSQGYQRAKGGLIAGVVYRRDRRRCRRLEHSNACKLAMCIDLHKSRIYTPKNVSHTPPFVVTINKWKPMSGYTDRPTLELDNKICFWRLAFGDTKV